MRINWYYSAGKLHKADYDYLVYTLEQEMEKRRLEEGLDKVLKEVEEGSLAISDEGVPIKSVHKIKRYTSEGKPITDGNEL